MRTLNLRLLQLMVALGAIQALVGGGYYLWSGVAGLEAFSDLPLEVSGITLSRIDYMFRAIAGIWFALGVLLAYLVVFCERHLFVFAIAYFAIFMMGVGRYLSYMSFGETEGNSHGAMIAELILPVVMIVWQQLTVRKYGVGV